MKPITAEWVAKDEGDFAAVEREARARKNPNYNGLCFHAQQCAEKYLKALLCEADVTFPRIHFLPALLDLSPSLSRSWEGYREDLTYLSNFAVIYRYPGEASDRESALDARRRCRRIRQAAREALELE